MAITNVEYHKILYVLHELHITVFSNYFKPKLAALVLLFVKRGGNDGPPGRNAAAPSTAAARSAAARLAASPNLMGGANGSTGAAPNLMGVAI